MTPTLVRQHLRHTGPPSRVDSRVRARDWAEIQERMLVPLHEAVYERLEVDGGTRLLGLGCGSGLALLTAAARGAAVTGVDDSSPERVRLARERLVPEGHGTHPRGNARIVRGTPADLAGSGEPAYDLVTAFEPVGGVAGDSEGLVEVLETAAPLAERGAAVVLVGWGPPERCATSAVLRGVGRLAEPLPGGGGWRAPRRDELEEIAERAGLGLDGSGRVACPFGYADVESAVRGLLSTGLLDAAVAATDEVQVDKELTEALHPHRRRDGTVWMPNVFRYLVARTR
ncbi:methyltransferase domain-containing protein [Streptomyces sp. NBC_01571]|uniref:methyltransferase domain-containing protein n=1 Tax=Streptomyces sp. NBC_01571 TaxID=2975883 RepID=UPI0022524386|nr:methyltransferase domain-containing protein [Streptomyces sp. NBC_01571]MCX4577779.1 methyltransferase domain-containing protein [Streptomyces sp. NBC_01571]